jgi:hypothetical protein
LLLLIPVVSKGNVGGVVAVVDAYRDVFAAFSGRNDRNQPNALRREPSKFWRSKRVA